MSRLTEVLFIAIHPFESLRAKGRQIMVAIEHELPPVGQEIEKFPDISIMEAAQAIRDVEGGGVPKSAWTQEDQERMERGELPQVPPAHPNI